MKSETFPDRHLTIYIQKILIFSIKYSRFYKVFNFDPESQSLYVCTTLKFKIRKLIFNALLHFNMVVWLPPKCQVSSYHSLDVTDSHYFKKY